MQQFTLDELARLTGFTRWQLYHRLRQHQVPHTKQGHTIMLSLADIMPYLPTAKAPTTKQAKGH